MSESQAVRELRQEMDEDGKASLHRVEAVLYEIEVTNQKWNDAANEFNGRMEAAEQHVTILRQQLEAAQMRLAEKTQESFNLSAVLENWKSSCEANQSELKAVTKERDELVSVLQRAIDQVFSEQTSFDGENRTAWIWRDADKLIKKIQRGQNK